MKILSGINNPDDIKKLDLPSQKALCDEVRKYIIDTVSLNGGHLSSNLGSVELTVALLSVFSPPDDKIIFDVGHQSYAYKILTDRKEEFKTLRQKDGISGFPKSKESAYDSGTGGHASTSVSLGLGLSTAAKLLGKENNVVAVIGDGALTGGLAFEGLNNISKTDKKLIIIINDNDMSISENVGAFSRYLSELRSSSEYLKTKEDIKSALNKIPVVGKGIKSALSKSKEAVKKAIYKNSYFSDMGLDYYGPVDGHDIEKLESVLSAAKSNDAPSVIHVITKKGKGYVFSENNPKRFHGIGKFDPKTGRTSCRCGSGFSDEFGKYMIKKGSENVKVCAITAAMADGTGLDEFAKVYPDRFFDVGIAEEHAAVFAAGLSEEGVIPVTAIYSAFLLRATDEIINDCAIENKHTVFAVDRAGFVGADGETHNGLFDVSVFSSVPGVEIYCPSNYNELRAMLDEAIDENGGVSIVRYPKGEEDEALQDYIYSKNGFDIINKGSDTVLITYGRTFSECVKASEKTGSDIIKLNRLSSYKEAAQLLGSYKNAIFFEEGIKSGGIGEKMGAAVAEKGISVKYRVAAVDGAFVPHMSVAEAMGEFSLDEEGILKVIGEM